MLYKKKYGKCSYELRLFKINPTLEWFSIYITETVPIIDITFNVQFIKAILVVVFYYSFINSRGIFPILFNKQLISYRE